MRLHERPFLFIGMVHLAALPNGPRPSAGFHTVADAAMRDAMTLMENGADGVILENFGDAPFTGGPVAPHVLAFVAVLAAKIRDEHPAAMIGINLLRNDARGAMGAAAAANADFIRVNVHCGAMLTDQGLLTGEAHATLSYRQNLGAPIGIAADILVKHAVPLAPQPIAELAADTWRRGGADVLIVTGSGTGKEADANRVDAVRDAVPEARIWVGSGVQPHNAAMWRRKVDGMIVGTSLHQHGHIHAPIDPARVRQLTSALAG